MINKLFKSTHIKYKSLFKFLFFLRYLISIFFISSILFLLIPKFFNYEKKEVSINNFLMQNYNFEMKRFDKISYNFFPVPNLEISNVIYATQLKNFQFKTKKLVIYPKLLSIYNFENFKANKIKLYSNEISTEFTELKIFIKNFVNLKKKIQFSNSDVILKDKNISLLKLENLNFSNYGYKKNSIHGNFLEHKFKINIKDDSKIVDFKLLNTGVSIFINFIEKNKGSIKSKILSSKLKFDFFYDKDELLVSNLFFRNKYISLNNNSSIIINPYLSIDLKSEIKDFNLYLLQTIDFKKVLQAKEILKKMNIKSEINYDKKKLNNKTVNNFTIKNSLIYGRLSFSKIFSALDTKFICNSEINLLEENPVLFFDCNINSKNTRKLFKKFSINLQNKNKNSLLLNFAGNLNIYNNKINFSSIDMDGIYQAKKEDLLYYKKIFEETMFDDNFLKIFNLKKFEKFILEIS